RASSRRRLLEAEASSMLLEDRPCLAQEAVAHAGVVPRIRIEVAKRKRFHLVPDSSLRIQFDLGNLFRSDSPRDSEPLLLDASHRLDGVQLQVLEHLVEPLLVDRQLHVIVQGGVWVWIHLYTAVLF